MHRAEEGRLHMADDPMSVNYIRDLHVAADPYRFFESLRTRCPVVREPHHEVATVSGWQAAVDVYNDAETFSSCITVSPGPFPWFPCTAEAGRHIAALIAAHRDEIPFGD